MKIPIRINEILSLPINGFGKEGDPIIIYNNFIIFVKGEEKISVNVNSFIKIRITKILPRFAIAEIVK